ncbi:hypothetical protein [Nonomuraea sp. NPDC048826]|uniref:hypothetical protein n=1 Tax=Nonomuraea sp. NPDC048826 TaxID=3364347 RepID=UPI00370F7F8E
MIERADQLIFNYVSKAADAAHGVLRPDQRLDFTRRLRARIEQERQGSQSAKDVTRLLARFGDPVLLVEREVRRLAQAAAPAPSPSPSPASASPESTLVGDGPLNGPEPVVRPVNASEPVVRPAAGEEPTAAYPRIRDDVPPGVARSRRLAEQRLARQERGLPLAGLRRAAMSVANPMVTEGRDARTMVKEHPREAAALVVLVMAALLVPFGLPPVAIFQVPVIAWAVGAVMVMFSDTWALRERLIGAGAPLVGYTAGGLIVGGFRVGGEPGLQRFVIEFFNASGVMFMIGTGVGVAWLAYRLLDQE